MFNLSGPMTTTFSAVTAASTISKVALVEPYFFTVK